MKVVYQKTKEVSSQDKTSEHILQTCLRSVISIADTVVTYQFHSNHKLVYLLLCQYQMLDDAKYGLLTSDEGDHLGGVLEWLYSEVERQINLCRSDLESIEAVIQKISTKSKKLDRVWTPRYRLDLHKGSTRFFEPIISELIGK